MLQKIPIENILFMDIETVPAYETWEALSEQEKNLWDKKTFYQRKEEPAEEYYAQRAGVMAEFGKIICITVGMIDKSGKLKITSFYDDDDEQKILHDFGQIFNSIRLANVILCAHNGKEFDFPWIARRLLVNGMTPPLPFQMFGKKPWEIPHLDTMELWKFGDYKTFVSLELLAHLFGIPTPKDDIDGSMVAEIYWKEKDLERIVRYCEKDVLTLANVFRRMRQEELLTRSENEL